MFFYFLLLFFVFSTFFSLFTKQEDFTNYHYHEPRHKKLYIDKNNYEVIESNRYGKCLVIDKEIQLCDKKEHIYHEMIVHFPVQYVENQSPTNVLIIGGGDLMTLREIMKYKSIANVYQLELDPKVVDISKKFFKVDDFHKSKKVKIIYGNAFDTIDKVDSNFFDLCIVDTTEDNSNNLPVDSIDFFKKCLDKLKPTGVLVKNGEHFAKTFAKMKMKVIEYAVFLDYFNSKYSFVMFSKNNKIKDVDVIPVNWENKKIKTKFYNIHQHHDYIEY